MAYTSIRQQTSDEINQIISTGQQKNIVCCLYDISSSKSLFVLEEKNKLDIIEIGAISVGPALNNVW